MKKYFVLLALIFSSAAVFSQTSINNLSDWNAFMSRIANNQSQSTDHYILNDDVGISGSSILTTPVSSMINGTFRGRLNGGMHKITVNITSSESNVGLFSQANGSCIESLIIDGSITGTSANANVGGFAGEIVGYFEFHNCINLASVTGSGANSIVGGIVGGMVNSGTLIQDCVNNGTITGGKSVGGITGSISLSVTTIIGACKNSGTIQRYGSTTPTYMAGIIGYVGVSNNIHIHSAVNIGRILSSNSQYAGGIAAYVESSNTIHLSTSVNAGIVDGATNSVGGIVGFFNGGLLANCINVNWVSHGSASYYGSIIGNGSNVTIMSCYNDNQMCILGGINNVDITNQAEGIPTAGMIGNNLSVSSINTPVQLYPLPYRSIYNNINLHPIELLAMAPVYLMNNEKVNNVAMNFTVSNYNPSPPSPPPGVPYPYKWGWFGSVYKSFSLNNFVEIAPPNTATILLQNGWDSLTVRLDNYYYLPYSGYNIIFEKIISINVK